jgi:hypothetical protein
MTNEEIEAKAIQAFEERRATPSSAERQRSATYKAEIEAEMLRIFGEDPQLPEEIVYGKPISAYGIDLVKAPNSGLTAVYNCTVCHEEHTFPIGALVAAGEFYSLRAKEELKCTAKPKTVEEKVLDVLGEIRDALKAQNHAS